MNNNLYASYTFLIRVKKFNFLHTYELKKILMKLSMYIFKIKQSILIHSIAINKSLS